MLMRNQDDIRIVRCLAQFIGINIDNLVALQPHAAVIKHSYIFQQIIFVHTIHSPFKLNSFQSLGPNSPANP